MVFHVYEDQISQGPLFPPLSFFLHSEELDARRSTALESIGLGKHKYSQLHPALHPSASPHSTSHANIRTTAVELFILNSRVRQLHRFKQPFRDISQVWARHLACSYQLMSQSGLEDLLSFVMNHISIPQKQLRLMYIQNRSLTCEWKGHVEVVTHFFWRERRHTSAALEQILVHFHRLRDFISLTMYYHRQLYISK